MISKINKTEEIKKRLTEEGKFSYLDGPEHLEATKKMNEEMKEIRRDYKQKEQNSKNSAANGILTA